ncbi:MAG: hypothetical protein MZW92_56430 [Comamonadaceae bacterium]|nr:hypothetical protein [Comamonadaceae bacterium]
MLAEASTDREEILVGEVDLAAHRGGAARTGRSCATAASTPTAGSTRRFIDVSARRPARDARARGLPACRPSGSRHEATWLGWPHNALGLAGQVRADPVGLRARSSASSPAGETSCSSWCRRRPTRRRRGASSRASAPTPDRVEFFRWPTDRGWTRDSGPDLRARARHPEPEVGDRAASASTRWAKYPDHRKDDAGRRARGARRSACRCSAAVHRRPAGRARGRRHRRRTAGARSSPPRSACSTRRSRSATPASARADYEQVFREHLGATQRDLARPGASPATTPTATSTTCAASSSARDDRALPRARTRGRRTTARSRRTASGCRRRASRTARGPRSWSCRCRRRSSSTAGGCPRATRTSTSPTRPSSCPTFNDPTDRVALGHPRRALHATARSSASTPSSWSGASARCTA